jgi:hypothetical protein
LTDVDRYGKVRYAVNPNCLKSSLTSMSYQSQTYAIANRQEDLERHLLDASVVDREQLAVAKRWQERQEGPLLMVLLQLSFIDLQQFSGLLDWSAQG